MRRWTPLLLALLVSCTATTEDTVSTTAVPVTTTAVVETASQVFDVVAMASHPNGAQLRVDRIEVFEDSIVFSGVLTNGSQYGLRVGGGTTAIRTAGGATAGLVERFSPGEISPGDELEFTLRFESLSDADALTLLFNTGGGASPVSPSTSRPSFEVGPILLDLSAARPDLPEPVPVRRYVGDPWGIELQAEGIIFADNRLGVWVRISNPLDSEARIAASIGPSLVVDDLGNRYPLVLPAGESWISIPAGTAQSGALVFAGRIHPDAKSLDIGINIGSGSGRDGGRIYPEFLIEDVPLEGDAGVAPLPQRLEIDEVIEHPAGVNLEALSLLFADLGIELPIVATNESATSVALGAGSSFAFDDLGNRYPLIPLIENPDLVIDSGVSVEARLVFSGRVADDASSLLIVLNDGLSTTDPDTRQPSFRFGPYELVRSDTDTEPITARVFAVGRRSRLAPDELAVSQVFQITETLTQFDATEVEGGFQLTLPDSILFDFGSAEIRGDAQQALTLIAEVLVYFEDAEVIVVGHTDSIGDPAANQRLSELRAQSVLDALVQDHGIPAERLSAEGRGATEPVAPNTDPDGSDNPDGRQLNRRVEIVVLTDEPVPLP